MYHPSSIGEDIPSFKVRIKLYGEGTLYYNYINQEGTYTNVAVKSEIFETPICYNTKYIGEKGVNVGFTLGVHSGECSGTITQIPSFEGAFVTDGNDGSHGYDEEERMLLMQMLGVDGNERYNDYGDEHFNKQEAKRTVDEMYHVKDGKKYIGEKYDMQKAHEVCSKFKDKLEDEVEVADVYVAINAQYHDYCELFEKWFGKGNFDDMIFESAISFWFDDVDFGEDKLWKYFNELK